MPAETLLVNGHKGPKPAALKGKNMSGLSKTSSKKSPRRRSRARKNPAGMFDQAFLKDSMWPLALGFAAEYLDSHRGRFKFWDKQSNRNRMLILVVAGAYMRSKGRADLHGAALAMAGVYGMRWHAEKSAAKAGVVAEPAPAPGAGQATHGMSIQDLYEAADREMAQVDVGAIFDGGDDDYDPVPVGELGAIWQHDDYAAA